MTSIESRYLESLRATVRLLDGTADDFDPLLDRIGDDVRLVLIGEASHGTHEFYQLRADLTRRLICEKGFNAVLIEGDWPDAWRVNRFVRGFDDDADATDALSGFARFPQWMWRNADVLDFVGWLREHNDAAKDSALKTGFYGMDLYSLYSSIQAVLDYLDKVDHAAAMRARYRYACFEHFREDPQAYGYSAAFDIDRSCEDQVVQQLVEIRQKLADYVHRDGRFDPDEHFFAEQNARLIRNAEHYYRSMFGGRVPSWNLRDTHMVETVVTLMDHLGRTGRPARAVLWAHNSHLGDARATEMSDAGEINVGQLLRERFANRCFNIGFSTYRGTVTAADDWDGPARRMEVRPGLDGSYEDLFHQAGLPGFCLLLRGAAQEALEVLAQPRLQRAIGVIYRPQTERLSHYFLARVAEQFDAMIHIDQTRAVEPLERRPTRRAAPSEAETYPTGV